MSLTVQFQQVAIGDCCQIISGSTPSRLTPEYWSGNINWFTPKDLSGIKTKYVTEAPEKITELGLRNCSTALLPEKSLLLSSRAPIGHLAINLLPSCTNQGFKSLMPKNNLDVEYLYYAIKNIVPQLQDMGNGATFKEISKAILSKVKIPVPPLTVQKKIAAILDTADSLIQKDQQLVERYTALSQSLFLEMFGDPLSNPKKWKQSALASLVKAVIDCPHTTPKWTDSGKVAIRTSNLTAGGWVWDDKRYVSENEYHERSARAYVKPGDIVLSREGTVGVAAIVSSDMEICLGQRLVQIQPNLQLADNYFLLNLILYELAPERIERVMVGATSKHLNLKDLRSMKMIAPPITLQNQFAERIQLIEAQKQQAQRNLEKSEALFNSLLQRAFTGELTAKIAA